MGQEEYTSFGKEQLERINTELSQWVAKQQFATQAPSKPSYGQLSVKLGINERGLNREEYPDHVEWDLRFEHKVPDGVSEGWVNRSFSDGLLHTKRVSNLTEFNSAPTLFTTANYVHVRVGNGERGWVEKGLFPKNVHLGLETVEKEEDGLPGFVQIPVYTDIRRDALVGFNAALEWAKFRTMAVACKDNIYDALKFEWKAVSKDYNERQLMRARTETAIPLMLSLLPDVRIESGDASLKPNYLPGILEAAVALEISNQVSPHHGTAPRRPIGYMTGNPIQIIPTPGKSDEYDARIPLNIHISAVEEAALPIYEKELRKYMNAKFVNLSNLNVTLEVPKAHEVRKAILDGKKDTSLHTQLRALSEALYIIESNSGDWRPTHDTIKIGYNAMIQKAQETHFGQVEQRLLSMRRY